jgi:hypothetical protein
VDIRKLMGHPIVTTTSLLVGIISFIVMVYIACTSRVYPELTYYVNPIRIALVHKG